MEVGVYVKGQSIIEPIEGIELKRCITWKQLAKHNIRLLENVKKEDIENIKHLPMEGSTYSIGACDSDVKAITLYITNLQDILDEKDTIKKEKEKNIKAIKKTTEEKVKLEQDVSIANQNIATLRDKIANLTLDNNKKDAEIQEWTRKYDALNDKYNAETDLRQRTEKELREYKDNLGTALQDTEKEYQEQENQLKTQHSNEIQQIRDAIQKKDEEIAQLNTKIDDLTRVNKELGKSGAIPEISYKYNGKATIIGFCGSGSYGVSNLACSVFKLIYEKTNSLLIDLDFKGGSIGTYLKSENKAIENVLRGGALLREHIIKGFGGRSVDYIGGIIDIWQPYDILNIPWDEIFSGDYDYIICDCGLYGGYNIQTTICKFIQNIGKMYYIHKLNQNDEPSMKNIVNLSNTNEGLPYLTDIAINDGKLLCDNPLCEELIQTYIVNNLDK